MQIKRLPLSVARLTAATIAVLLVAGGSRAEGNASLEARQDFAVGKFPVAVLAADFDQDGHLDLIIANQISNEVNLIKGFGDGFLRRFATLQVGLTPTGLQYADVNGDGKPDVVTSNFLTQGVRVNLGDGTGAFGAPLRTGVGATPFGVVVGHWDGDGLPDIATVNSTLDSMSILPGLGTGLFGTPVQIPVGEEPLHLITDHFNADADANADLAVVNKVDKNVQVWQGDGIGGFSLLTTIATGIDSSPVYLASGDFDEDGSADLAVCDQGENNVLVYFGDGAGLFTGPTIVGPLIGPLVAIATDYDGDDNLDLLVATAAASGVGELAILLGDGAGGFGAPATTNTGPNPTALTVGDFDEDGDLDVVVSNKTANTVSLVVTDGGGIFVEAGEIPLAINSFPFDIAVADFNSDGNPDVVSSNLGSDDISMALGDGLGGFGVASTTSTGNFSGPQGILAVDVDGDSSIDLVTMNTGDDSMSVLQNSGTGNFQASNGQWLGVCQSPVAVAAGELSGDMIADLAIICDVSDHLCTRIGTGGSGSAAFGPASCTVLVEKEPGGVALGNFNFDALEDAVVTSRQDNIVAFANADGAGGITGIPATFPVGADPVGVARADLNGDGFDDIVVTNTLSATISTYLMDGGGAPLSFPAIDSPAGEGPFDIALADFNLDGKLDAAVVNGNANNVSLLLGDGFGNFSKAGDFGTRNLPLGIGAADFNNDGWPDIVVADHFADSISVLLNRAILSDPLLMVRIFQGDPTVFRWGLVPGAVYDVIRVEAASVTPGATAIDLGPAICMGEDLSVTDTANTPDADNPTPGQAHVYFIRPVIAGVPGSYGTSSDGRERLPNASGCL